MTVSSFIIVRYVWQNLGRSSHPWAALKMPILNRVKKMNKLQVKYERFDVISKTYKLVWQKDGGDTKFIDVYSEGTTLFKDICAKVENQNCNYFVKVLHDCVTSMNDITRQQLDENECLWDYLKKENLLELLENMSEFKQFEYMMMVIMMMMMMKMMKTMAMKPLSHCFKSCLIIAFNQIFCHYIFFYHHIVLLPTMILGPNWYYINLI